ncbi:MAG: DUF3343 domain-containing protein [Acidobacteria bacterium]|nr:DUF3343 domain-containing protein [Acidobacteriota bacterium]
MSDVVADYGVVLFYTSSAAIRAEKILLKDGIPVKLIPTPRELSSDCGVALRFSWCHEMRARELLASACVEIASIHMMN